MNEEKEKISIKSLSEMPSKELGKTFLFSQVFVLFWLLVDYLIGDLPPVGKPFGFFWTLILEVTYLVVFLIAFIRKFVVFRSR